MFLIGEAMLLNFDLSNELTYMACQYGKVPQGLQTCCTGCGDLFNMNHALNCKNGGLVYQRHNEVRDENCEVRKKAGFSQVLGEPFVNDAGEDGIGLLEDSGLVRRWLFLMPAYALSMQKPFLINPYPLKRHLISTEYEKKNLNDAVEQKRSLFLILVVFSFV
jgi:hypothetical protein